MHRFTYRIILKLSLVLLLLMVMVACQAQPEKKPADKATKEKKVQVNLVQAKAAKDAAKSIPGVQDATSVMLEQNISTAIKVTGFDRLKLKSIKEEVHKKITELGPEYEVYVTSDKKLFKELQDIEKSLVQKGEKTAPESLYQKVLKINEAMKG